MLHAQLLKSTNCQMLHAQLLKYQLPNPINTTCTTTEVQQLKNTHEREEDPLETAPETRHSASSVLRPGMSWEMGLVDDDDELVFCAEQSEYSSNKSTSSGGPKFTQALFSETPVWVTVRGISANLQCNERKRKRKQKRIWAKHKIPHTAYADEEVKVQIHALSTGTCTNTERPKCNANKQDMHKSTNA